MNSETEHSATPEPPASDALDLEARVEELEQQLGQVRDEQLRERAELENQRRRLIRDVEQARKFANEKLLAELLPVFDSLEAGLAAEGEVERLREGMELTLRQLRRVAETSGLSMLDPAGEAFNPEWHQAMSMVPAPDHAPGSVVQVYQKGYVLNERLLRPALVVVAAE
ncbi:nucleotide exchange factor GrpE [Xanthomonadaceae bacterium JHOS43]|nr:nucleotide exchange factor GrpE [Xanthomonadaceae bacterium JHOS43]MCX7563348.1 nucleotide exchange factor GrpE [Xanthomonadaceae bacterium XH05]